LLSKNIKIKKNYNFACGSVREEYRLKVFENRVLRKIFGLRRDEVTGDGGNCIMRSFITCTPRQT
jgi:hypothetical protein